MSKVMGRRKSNEELLTGLDARRERDREMARKIRALVPRLQNLAASLEEGTATKTDVSNLLRAILQVFIS